MLIQDKHVDLLQAPSSSMWAGCSSRDFESEIVRITGARSRAGQAFIDFFLPEKHSHDFLRYLSENPRISLLCSNIFTFETFQVKGLFIGSRTSTAAELQWQRSYLDQLGQNIVSIGIKAGHGYSCYYSEPALTLRMQAEEVFDQTPKPGAGKKIS